MVDFEVLQAEVITQVRASMSVTLDLDQDAAPEDYIASLIERFKSIQDQEICEEGCVFHTHGPRPRKVYLVLESERYEGDRVVAVHYSKVAAETDAKVRRKTSTCTSIDVEEMDIS